jgi:hypothetical protein
MATPTYNGSGQPAANSGWLGGLGSWFGVATPAYAGAGQSVTGSTGYFSGTTPAYKSTSTPTPTPNAASACPERITLVVPRELLEPQS